MVIYSRKKICVGHCFSSGVRGLKVQLHGFLTSTLVEGECLDSRLDRFTPREIAHGTNWIGECAGPISDPDVVI
jgi:hypothetical protein